MGLEGIFGKLTRASDKTSGRQDPYAAYHFRVDIHSPDGTSSYPFRSCSGLKSESGVVEIQEGGFNTTTRKLIGPTKYPNLVLKQGFCDPNSSLWALRLKFMNDLPPVEGRSATAERRWKGPNRFNGTITQMAPQGVVEAKWAFVNAWICKWEGPDFDASKNEISIETIEIAHEGLYMMRADAPKSDDSPSTETPEQQKVRTPGPEDTQDG